jgi:hypothetical protein
MPWMSSWQQFMDGTSIYQRLVPDFDSRPARLNGKRSPEESKQAPRCRKAERPKAKSKRLSRHERTQFAGVISLVFLPIMSGTS